MTLIALHAEICRVLFRGLLNVAGFTGRGIRKHLWYVSSSGGFSMFVGGSGSQLDLSFGKKCSELLHRQRGNTNFKQTWQ